MSALRAVLNKHLHSANAIFTVVVPAKAGIQSNVSSPQATHLPPVTNTLRTDKIDLQFTAGRFRILLQGCQRGGMFTAAEG